MMRMVFLIVILIELITAQPSEDEAGMSLQSSTEDEAGVSLGSSTDEAGMSLASDSDWSEDMMGNLHPDDLLISSSSDEGGLSIDSSSEDLTFDILEPSSFRDEEQDLETVQALLPPPKHINTYLFAEVSSGKKMKSKATSLLSIKSALKNRCVCGENCLNQVSVKTIRELRSIFWNNAKTVRMQLLKYYISHSEKRGKFRFLKVDQLTVCSKAFCVIYRIDKNTFSRGLDMERKKKATVVGKQPREISEQSLNLLNWLEDYGTYHGDRMPDTKDVLLPYKSVKTDLYWKYTIETQNCGNHPVSKSQFFKIWDTYFPHLKIKKTNSFSKCTTCTTLEKQLEKTTCVQTRAPYKQLKDDHNQRQMLERKYYYGKRESSKKHPEAYLSMIIDGMDQSKTNLPHFTGRLPKNIKATDLLKTHVTGVISHGHGGFHTFVDLNEYPHDPNLTINVLLKMLKKTAEKHENKLPRTFYIQADNCGRENKNRYVLAFCELLVTERIFDEVHLSFLYVGHTHEDVDAGFSHIAENLRKTDVEVITDLLAILPNSERLENMFDVKSWLAPEIKNLVGVSEPLHFKFERSVSGITTLYYKGQQNSKWIMTQETLLMSIPKGEPSKIMPDYSKIDLEKQFKQVQTVKGLFKKHSSLNTWKEFYETIGRPAAPREAIWILNQLPRQETILVDQPEQMPEEIQILLEKDRITPQVKINKRRNQQENQSTNVKKRRVTKKQNKKTGQKKNHSKDGQHKSSTNKRKSSAQVLKEDLMTYYRENESMIPAAPLVDEHKVPIEELYVLPPMRAYDKPLNFDLGKNTQKGDQPPGKAQEKKKTSFSQLFLSDKNVRYRKIYITADAGFGKTSLSQKLTMTWCQSHLPLTSLTGNYIGEELAAMKYFDYLFLLHLRDYQSEQNEQMCNLDDLIMHMLSNNLSRNTLYTKDFLQRLLHEKTCLIILDGLDEWAHPDKCRRTPAVPHNKHPDSCTVLTTSRPWKLGTIGLSEHNIDRHIDISELDWRTGYQLKENAIRILNERNLNRAGKNIEDFNEAVESVEIGDIIYNPYILLQLMCVFFDGLPIGKSKCEINSNITEFSLERGLKKKDLPDIHVQTSDNALVPNCMNENETCKRYFILLMKLGKLAFYTLFSEKRESSLIFDSRIVTQYMTEQEIEFCLKVGLLCQTKDSSKISVKRYHVFFQHKSVQEFFSAIYITSEWQNESVKSIILNVCSSLSGILEMSNVFVFVCGINPEVYTCISGELQTIVDLDSSVCQFRTDMYIDRDGDALKSMKSYQSMQLECLQESLRNGNDSCPIPLYFVLDKHSLTYDVKALKSKMQVNDSIGKSPQVSLNEKIVAAMLSKYPPFVFMQTLDPGVFTSLETLRVDRCDKEPVWLADILTESARTLKCLTLSPGYRSLSDIIITALTGLTCLQSLYLGRYVLMTLSNLKCLYAYISQTTTLTQLKLVMINCSDHKWGQYRDCDVILDLHRLNELKMLHLEYVPCRELHVNPACLEKLEFSPWKKMTARDSAILWQDLRAAPVLSSLTLWDMTSCQEMIQTIPTLTQLQHLHLRRIDMGDVIPISPAMTHLEHVVLQEVTMSSAAWQGLLISVGQLQHPVTVKLSDCKGPSEEEWRTIVNVIKTTPTLSLLPDLSIYSWGSASLTLKNKTVK